MSDVDKKLDIIINNMATKEDVKQINERFDQVLEAITEVGETLGKTHHILEMVNDENTINGKRITLLEASKLRLEKQIKELKESINE